MEKLAHRHGDPFERENNGEGCGRSFFTCRAAGKAYDLRRHQKTNEGTKNMGGRKGIGQKEQTQPDLGPTGLVACPLCKYDNTDSDEMRGVFQQGIFT